MKIRWITIRRIHDLSNFRFYQKFFRQISVFTENLLRQINDSSKYIANLT